MTLLEKLEEARADLEKIVTAVEAGEEVTEEEMEQAMDAVKTAQKNVDNADEAQKLIKSLETPKEGKADKEVKEMPRSIGENFVEHIKSMNVGKRFDVSAPAFKAATDIQTSPSGAVDFATTFDKNVVEAARTPLVVRDLFGAETISGSTLVYLVEGAIQGAPAVTAEGNEKPQVHFADPTPKTVSLAKIACHIKESDEYINDYPFLASAINGRLLYELGLVEQNKLVTDLLATSGIQAETGWAASTTAAQLADLILDAAMKVQQNSGFPADAILINPADWYSLRIAKDGENRYYGGGFFGTQAVADVWGIPVCVTTAVTAGKIVVGAFKTCASVVQNGGVSVEAVNTNEDDFVKNLMTIRAEERLALAVRRPAGFCHITKASS